MKNLKMKVIVPLLLLAVTGICSSLLGLSCLKQLGTIGSEIVSEQVPVIIVLDAISANVEEMQKLLLTHSIMDTKEDKAAAEQEISVSAATLKAYLAKYRELSADEASYNELMGIYEEYMDNYNDTLSLSAMNNTRAVTSQVNGVLSDIFGELNDKVSALIQEEQTNLGVARGRQDSIYSNAVIIAGGMLIIMLVIFAASAVVMIHTIIRPTIGYEKKLREITEKINDKDGDLTQRIPVRTGDEIGRLVQGVNLFIMTLQNIMGKIVSSSVELDTSFRNVNSSISEANIDSSDISAAMEEVAATMDMVTTTLNGVNQNAAHAGENVNEVMSVTKDIHRHTIRMRDHAEELEKTAVTNKDGTNKMLETILVKLNQAIENSRSVARVDELTNEILSISGQTNLLALNASIEAARAGDAGKGFAVVAEEIRQLADSSRETANKIQNINGIVVGAVKELSANANEIMEYISATILPDYDNYAVSGKEYREDAEEITRAMDSCLARMDDLTANITSLAEQMNEIARAVGECNQGISTSAESTSKLVEEINHVYENVESSVNVVQNLKQQSDSFTNL